MPRIKISLPTSYLFTASIPVRITDLNYGGHVGNDAVLSILHEARLQFLKHFGYSELSLGGVSLIMADAGLEFKGESFYGDVLSIQIGVQDLHKFGFDLVYLAKNQAGKEIVRAKTGMLCFNYETRKLAVLPTEIAAQFETKPAGNL
jgi:acyl-CoA thioester hydrolase